MAWITDSLTRAISFASRLSPFQRVSGVASTSLPGVFTHQLAVAAYMSSGMLRKVIRVPAADRTQKWRDWQADADSIGKIEAEEKRLQLRAKTKEAETLRGIGGGALLLITAGQHDQPLTPNQIGERGLIAINVVSRWELRAKDFDRNLASPTYRQPAMFEISNGTTQQNIHPSRVICFRGPPLPSGSAVSDEESFWGDSRLLQVFREVENSDHAQAWFVELVKKAKLLRVGIPDLLDMMATSDGQAKLDARIALIATGESTLNATVYRSGTGTDDPGEKIDDYQVNWTGIPAFMDALDQRVAAVSDIPFTRLMGRSPAGMNATGKSDQDNYWAMVSDGQENETRPCLEAIDPLLLRSAGVAKPDDVTWKWAPLWTPTEAEEATTFKTTMEAVEKLQQTGAIPDQAFAEGVQNLMLEREYVPGLEAALAKIPEGERYGLDEPEPDESDPSALQAANENEVEELRRRGAVNADQARALVTDARPRTLYVQRKLLNAAELIAWAKGQGFESTLSADELHVTVAYSRTAVDWLKLGSGWGEEDGKLTVAAGGARIVEPLGDKGAVVLLFTSSQLSWRHEEMIRNGASHDFPEYQPHVTITYAGGDVDLSKVEPYRGKLVFGPEIFEEIDEDWTGKPAEA